MCDVQGQGHKAVEDDATRPAEYNVQLGLRVD